MIPLFSKDSNSNSKRIYMDYAASTPVAPEVVSAMNPYWSDEFGNPGGFHQEARNAKQAISDSRKTIASHIGTQKENIIFTGSGTEANNLALFGVVEHARQQGMSLRDMHFITTPIEHPSVLDIFKYLEGLGASVTYVSVSDSGLIDVNEISNAMRLSTVLVSTMYINNETGAILPIADIGKVIDRFRKEHTSAYPLFHVDASQALLFFPLHVDSMRVDLMTLDAQKIYGPKGVGALYRRSEVALKPIMYGGNQEYGLRPGTENVPLIVGFATAIKLLRLHQQSDNEKLIGIRDYCIRRIEKDIPGAVVNGPIDELISHRSPNNVNISLKGQDNEFVTIALSERGISCGTRSACIGEKGGPSYVLEAMGKSDLAQSTLRFTFGKYSTKEDVDVLVDELLSVLCNFDNT